MASMINVYSLLVYIGQFCMEKCNLLELFINIKCDHHSASKMFFICHMLLHEIGDRMDKSIANKLYELKCHTGSQNFFTMIT